MKELTKIQKQKGWVRKGFDKSHDAYLISMVNGQPWMTNGYIVAPVYSDLDMGAFLGHLNEGQFDVVNLREIQSHAPSLNQLVTGLTESNYETAEQMTVGNLPLLAEGYSGESLAIYRSDSDQVIAFSVKQLQLIHAYGKPMMVHKVVPNGQAAHRIIDGVADVVIMPIRLGDIKNWKLDVKALVQLNLEIGNDKEKEMVSA